jgi:hypothetical protein
MATVEEVLRQTGLSDDEIKALDQKIMTGFSTILTSAESARADAQEAERRYSHLYQTEIVPALNNWGSEKATLTAERDFYKSQNEGARSAGFIPKDAPAHVNPNPSPQPERGSDGRYLPGGNPVPGSPGPAAAAAGPSMSQIMRGISNAQWAANEYMRLYNSPMPDDFDSLLEQSSGKMQDFRDYVSQKYGFEGKRKEMAETKAREHDEGIRKDERQKIEKEIAERGGSNPMLRGAASSNFATVRKAMESGRAKDPLTLNAEQRRMQTRDMISTDRAAHDSQGTA